MRLARFRIPVGTFFVRKETEKTKDLCSNPQQMHFYCKSVCTLFYTKIILLLSHFPHLKSSTSQHSINIRFGREGIISLSCYVQFNSLTEQCPKVLMIFRTVTESKLRWIQLCDCNIRKMFHNTTKPFRTVNCDISIIAQIEAFSTRQLPHY